MSKDCADPVGYPAYRAAGRGGFALHVWRVFDPNHSDVHGTWAASVKIKTKDEGEVDLLFLYGRTSADQAKVDIEQRLLRNLQTWATLIPRLERPGESR